MNDEQKTLMRNTLLVQLHDAAPSAVPVGTLWQGTKLAGFDTVNQRDVERELAFAVDKGLAESMPHPQNAALKRWRLTAAGRDYLEGEGLV